MSDTPCASVVIPCLNEVNHIGPCLASLRAQEGLIGRWEVLVVDGGSTDGTLDVVQSVMREWNDVRLLHNKEKFTPVSMNLGLKYSESDVVVILGGHAEADKDFLRRNLDALEAHPECGCVGGVVEQVLGDERTRTIGMAMSSPFGVGDARFRTGGVEGHVDTVAFGAYRKQVLMDIGGLDEDLVRNQDDELNFRLTETGWRIWFDPSIRSSYHARSSYGRLFQQYRQYGYWKVFVNRKHRTVTTWRQLVPAAFVLGVVLTGTAAAIGQWQWPGSLAAKAVTLSWMGILSLWGLGAMIAARMAKSGPSRAWGMLRAFAVLHWAYGWGYWQGIWHFLLLRKGPSSRAKTLTR